MPDAKFSTEDILAAYARLGNKAAVARELGCSRSIVSERLSKSGLDDKPMVSGRKDTIPVEKREIPPAGVVYRYILTCAQNNTRLHQPAWRALTALAKHYDAEIMVSRFTYNKGAFSSVKNVKPGQAAAEDDHDSLWFASEIQPHVCDKRVQLARGLVFCGEMNILPTAVNPLAGFESYTGRLSGIFPHTKIALRSVASAKYEATKFNYTTGTVTQRNYVQRTSGLKAESHHSYGALLVEVDSDGDFYVRQLEVDSKGELYDLDLKVTNKGRVVKSSRVEAINWGDVHATTLEEQAKKDFWGKGGMIDVLRPRFQFMHDLVDVRACDHHSRNNPHAKFARYVDEVDHATDDIESTAGFLCYADRKGCKTVVVNSNHDDWIKRWLREADYRNDPPNAIFFLEAQLEVYRHIEAKKPFDVVEWSLRRYGCPEGVQFLALDESFIICRGKDGGIECGHHGHNGINGGRGSAAAFSRTGRRTNTGHSHSAEIKDSAWVAGVAAALDQGYNKGLSSWSQSHIITQPNGMRQMVTYWNGKWRANG